MKTRSIDKEKIKQAMSACTYMETHNCECSACPYYGHGCCYQLIADANVYLNELEQQVSEHRSKTTLKGVLLIERGSCDQDEVDKLLAGTGVKTLIYREQTNKPELVYLPTDESYEQQLPACGFDIDMGNHDYERED